MTRSTVVLLLFLVLVYVGCLGPSVTVLSKGKLSASLTGIVSDWAISDGKYLITGLTTGSSITVPLRIYNDSSVNKSILVYSKEPNYLTESYRVMPKEWIKVSNSSVLVPSKSSTEVLAIVSIPTNASFTSNVEVWIGFKDTSKTGLTKEEYCSKILVKL